MDRQSRLNNMHEMTENLMPPDFESVARIWDRLADFEVANTD